jgi:hypothetical protein
MRRSKVLLLKEKGKNAGYIQEEWSRGCRPRATTDFPAILLIFNIISSNSKHGKIDYIINFKLK